MVLGPKPMGKLITCDNYLGGRQNQGIVWVLCRTKTYFLQALSMAIALPGFSKRTTKGDRRPSPLRVSDEVITCHELLGLRTSKPASLFFKKEKRKGGSRSSQHETHRRVLGYFWKGGGSAGIRV